MLYWIDTYIHNNAVLSDFELNRFIIYYNIVNLFYTKTATTYFPFSRNETYQYN